MCDWVILLYSRKFTEYYKPALTEKNHLIKNNKEINKILYIKEKLMVSKRDRLGWGDGLGVCNGNAIKLYCDDHCTTINVIKFIK